MKCTFNMFCTVLWKYSFKIQLLLRNWNVQWEHKVKVRFHFIRFHLILHTSKLQHKLLRTAYSTHV